METIGSKRSYALIWCMPNNDDDDGNINNCTVSGFVSETVSWAGFDGFAKPVSNAQIESCIKPLNLNLVSDRFRQIDKSRSSPAKMKLKADGKSNIIRCVARQTNVEYLETFAAPAFYRWKYRWKANREKNIKWELLALPK